MKVRVEDEKCQGHTLCSLAAPQLFGLREEDGHSYVLPAYNDAVPVELEAVARRAAEGCPEQAIVLEEPEGPS